MLDSVRKIRIDVAYTRKNHSMHENWFFLSQLEMVIAQWSSQTATSKAEHKSKIESFFQTRTPQISVSHNNPPIIFQFILDQPLSCSKKEMASSAISSAWLSDAKWPASRNLTCAWGRSFLIASAPGEIKKTSFFPQTAKSGTWENWSILETFYRAQHCSDKLCMIVNTNGRLTYVIPKVLKLIFGHP